MVGVIRNQRIDSRLQVLFRNQRIDSRRTPRVTIGPPRLTFKEDQLSSRMCEDCKQIAGSAAGELVSWCGASCHQVLRCAELEEEVTFAFASDKPVV